MSERVACAGPGYMRLCGRRRFDEVNAETSARRLNVSERGGDGGERYKLMLTHGMARRITVLCSQVCFSGTAAIFFFA